MLNNMLNNFDVDEDKMKTRNNPGRIKVINSTRIIDMRIIDS